MNAIDTNVLLYFVDKDEAVKQAKADALLTGLAIAGTPAALLWQVAAEFGAGLRRWEQKCKLTTWEREKLYSEDLSNNLVYDSVRVVNPFV